MIESVFSIITIIAVVALFVFYFFFKKKDGKDWIYAVFFLTAFITGIILFSLALSYKKDGDTSFSPLYLIASSIGLALKSFGGDFDASTLSALAKDNTLFAIASFVHYIVSVVLTFIVAIKIFGKNAINRVHVFINSLRAKYIVIGASGQAEIFLDNLDFNQRKHTTVILDANQKEKKKDLMSKGFAVVVIKDGKDLAQKKAINDKNNFAKSTFMALKTSGFSRTTNNTKIIAMSKDDEQNLLIAKLVTEYIKEQINPEKSAKGKIKLTSEQSEKLQHINLKAYIMYSSWDRAEHFTFTDYALGRIRFFSPAEMRARKFAIENPITSMIPTTWIDVEKAKLKKSYNIGNIFVGFGITNKQILEKSICNNQLLGVDYNAFVIDKNAKNHEKQFHNSAIGLFRPELKSGKDEKGQDRYFKNPSEKNKFVFEEQDALYLEFYEKICEEVERNDFATVIVALGNDKLSLETALELRQKLHERDLLVGETDRQAYQRVKIFVKIIEKTVFSDESLLNHASDCKIKTFGADKEVLSEEYIINEKLDTIAKRIANEYCDNSSKEVAEYTKWDGLPEIERDSNRYAAMSIRTKLNLLGFELKESNEEQDNAVAKLYEATYGMNFANRQQATVNKQWTTNDFSDGYVDFPERDEKGNIADTARNNLARLEHQRWSAFYLSNGWTKLEKAKVTADVRKDVQAKQHACLTVFEELEKLRDLQASDAVTKKGVSEEHAKSDEDTVRYDYFLMDKLLGNLKDSSYVVLKR